MAGWEDDLLKYLGRADVKASMHAFVVDARKRGVRFGSGSGGVVDDEAQARAVVENDIMPRIVAAIQSRIPSMDKDMFLRVATPEVNSDVAYVFHLVLDPKKVHRDSLYEGGLDNVVAYMSHGAKPLKHWVAGYWVSPGMAKRGYVGAQSPYYFIPEGYTREADPFLETTMNVLNGEFRQDGIEVILDSTYLPGGSGVTRGVRRT